MTDKQFSNTQYAKNIPVINKYPDRDLFHHHIKKTAMFIVPGNKNFNSAGKFGRKIYITEISMIKRF